MVVLGATKVGWLRAQAPDVGTEAERESGKKLYLKYCSQCHGEKGNGEGYATPHLRPRPRDFTSGKFKIRTTPNGALPTHRDLVNIIRRGMPYTSMPAWPTLSDQEVSELAYFITTFSADFTNPENVPKPVELPSAPGSTNASIELGKKLYVDTGCVKCHGTLGRGDGPSAPTLTDDAGHPIRAADLAQSWTFRGGSSREDIFRTMSTGLNGTPMPSFADALKPEERWAITDFIASLSGSNGPGYTNLVVAKHVKDPIDLTKGAAIFASASVARFPIIGQIMEPGRSFHPPTTSVSVQAVYDAESIALLVRWHDMSAEKTGKNGPSLPVPPEEEEEAAGGSSKGGVFGEEEVVPAPAGQAQTPVPSRRTPLPSRRPQPGRHPSSPTPYRCRFLRRSRRVPASPTSSSVTPRTRRISGSSIWPAPIPFGSPAREARPLLPATSAISPVWRATTRENGRSSSSGPCDQTRPPRSHPARSCRSPSRSGTGSRASVATGEVSRCGTPFTSSPKPSPLLSVRW